MRILRFDSVGGASGDMILGALVGLGVDPNELERELKRLIPEPFRLNVGEKSSFGATGVYLTVELGEDSHCHSHSEHEHGHCDHSHSGEHQHEHAHCDHSHSDEHGHCERAHSHEHKHGRTFATIRDMIAASPLDEKTKRDATAAFEALAVAEAEAHRVPVETVHFHEVGAVDSLVDTVGCVLALNRLGVDGISLSPLPVGEGTFRCQHGVYPLPAPATAILLRNFGLPISSDVERCEMLTPTAAALFGVWPKREIPVGARIVATANSFGTREMPSRPNLLRATIYETDDAATETAAARYDVETLFELTTNLDDATGERLAATAAALFDAGALDVWFEPILMKKGRPAHRLSALVDAAKRDAVLDAFFRHSGTFGVRETTVRRRFLARRWENVETRFGTIRVKIGATNDGEELTAAPEFDDCARAAAEYGVPVERVFREAAARRAEIAEKNASKNR